MCGKVMRQEGDASLHFSSSKSGFSDTRLPLPPYASQTASTHPLTSLPSPYTSPTNPSLVSARDLLTCKVAYHPCCLGRSIHAQQLRDEDGWGDGRRGMAPGEKVWEEKAE